MGHGASLDFSPNMIEVLREFDWDADLILSLCLKHFYVSVQMRGGQEAVVGSIRVMTVV